MKQSIIEEAYDYATEKTKFRKEVLKEVDADNYVSRHSDCMEDFQFGAEWQAKQSPWISVEERLPESDEKVLAGCWCKDYFKYLSVGKYLANIKGWVDDVDNTMNVTHWMPIPNLPEGGEE